MKQMYRILIVGLIVFMAGSCQKNLDNLSVSEAESRIVGKWTMTQVKNNVRGDGKWSKNDVSGSYNNWEFTFNADLTMNVYIPDEDLTLDGNWEVYEDWQTEAEGETDLNTFLYMYLYDPEDTTKWRELVWEDMRVSDSKFRGQEETVINGEKVFYFYEMER